MSRILVGSTTKSQNVFHGELTTYINSGILYHSDLYFSVFAPWLPFTRYAKAVIQKYERLQIEIAEANDPKLHVRIEPYKGENPHVHQMVNYLSEHLKEDLIGAYVHGSLGTYEEIPYSDFDALVILKDEVFESPEKLVRTAKKLNHARKIMLDFDPLQHHGWFVLAEVDLKFYCNAYFSIELFKYAKSLFDDKGLELEISLRKSDYETRETFEKMAEAIIRKIKLRQYPVNMCQLKSLLSGFMLLPSLYIQARDRRGIYKKESFDLVRVDFDSAHWAIMDEVSEIRADWSYEISPIKKWLMCHPYVLSRYFAKNFAPAIPEKIGRVLAAKFYARMEKLALLMKEMLA